MEKCSHPWLWIILDLVAFILVLGNCGQITKFTHLLPEGLGVPKNLQLRKKYKEVTLLFYCFSVGSYEYHVSESMASWGFFWKLSQRDGEKETDDRWLENKLRQSKQHVNYLCNKIHFWWSQRSRKLNNKLKLLWAFVKSFCNKSKLFDDSLIVQTWGRNIVSLLGRKNHSSNSLAFL